MDDGRWGGDEGEPGGVGTAAGADDEAQAEDEMIPPGAVYGEPDPGMGTGDEIPGVHFPLRDSYPDVIAFDLTLACWIFADRSLIPRSDGCAQCLQDVFHVYEAGVMFRGAYCPACYTGRRPRWVYGTLNVYTGEYTDFGGPTGEDIPRPRSEKKEETTAATRRYDRKESRKIDPVPVTPQPTPQPPPKTAAKSGKKRKKHSDNNQVMEFG